MTPNQLRELLRIRPAQVLARLTVLCGLWAILGVAIVHTDLVVLKVFLWAALGFVINGLVQLAHESWHNNLLPRPWQNRVFGIALGLLVGLSDHAMRHDHLAHHRRSRTSRDPDAYNAGRDSWGQRILFYAVVLFGLPLSVIYFNFLYPLQWFERRDLPRHFLRVGLGALGYAALAWCIIHADLGSLTLELWLIPLLATGPYNGLKSIADHHDNVWNGDRFHVATTVRTHPWVSWLWSGLNYHLDHHLFPRVPGYNLPRLHAHLREELERQNAPVFDGYLRVMWAALIAGPLVVDEDVNVVSVRRRGS